MYAFSPRVLPANPTADFEGKFCTQIMRTDSEEIHCCSLFQMESVFTLKRLRGESDVYGHNHTTSRSVRTEIARNRLFVKEAVLEKVWPMTRERVADLLADLVFVMLLLLLFVWVGLWTFVN